MIMMRKISTTDLQKLFGLVINKLSQYEKLDFPNVDLYWSASPPDCYVMDKKPELNVGSLYDDIDQLSKLLECNDRELTFVDFDRLASVLKAISEGMNPA